jgi:hypothetical protein
VVFTQRISPRPDRGLDSGPLPGYHQAWLRHLLDILALPPPEVSQSVPLHGRSHRHDNHSKASLRGHRYVAIKVYAANQGQAKQEVAAFKHIREVLNKKSATGCGGARFIRLLHKSFELDHPRSGKKNLCLVYEPMGMSLADVRKVACDGHVPLELLKPMLPYLLAALDFMHTKANMVHTGKSPRIQQIEL